MAIMSITDESFKAEVETTAGLVLVDFWAEWCGPCQMIAPILEELGQEMGSKVKICKMNIDDSPEVPTQYGVRSIPTLMLFKDGKLLATKVGVSPKSALVNWIEENK